MPIWETGESFEKIAGLEVLNIVILATTLRIGAAATMDKSELLKTLEKVHVELADAQSVDDATRQLLTTLTDDIRRLSEQSDTASAESVEPLTAQVQDLVLQFESDHPQLTTALNQVAGALANLGI